MAYDYLCPGSPKLVLERKPEEVPLFNACGAEAIRLYREELRRSACVQQTQKALETVRYSSGRQRSFVTWVGLTRFEWAES